MTSLPNQGTLSPLGTSALGRDLRVGFITHLDQHADVSTIYRDNIRLIQGLEELGYDSAWVATRHFFSGWAALPSPYSFFGAVAASTERISLGTAVLPLVLDDPVRVGEDVSVLDHLSGGRLLLGLGKGVPSDSFHVFESWRSDRDRNFEEKLDRLDWALQGSRVDGGTASIWPENAGLRGRRFVGSSNIETIRFAARRGLGLILERFGNGPERTPEARRAFQQRQADSVVEYRRVFHETWGDARTPYVITSRSAFPGATTAQALEEAARTAARWNEYAAQLGRVDLNRDAAGQLLSDNFIWGDADALVEDLIGDPTIALTDELVLGIHPVTHTIGQTLDRAGTLLDEVVPRLRPQWAEARAGLGLPGEKSAKTAGALA